MRWTRRLWSSLPGREQSVSSWPEPQPIPPRGDIGESAPFPLALLPPAVREVARFNKVPGASPALVGIGNLFRGKIRTVSKSKP